MIFTLVLALSPCRDLMILYLPNNIVLNLQPLIEEENHSDTQEKSGKEKQDKYFGLYMASIRESDSRASMLIVDQKIPFENHCDSLTQPPNA